MLPLWPFHFHLRADKCAVGRGYPRTSYSHDSRTSATNTPQGRIRLDFPSQRLVGDLIVLHSHRLQSARTNYDYSSVLVTCALRMIYSFNPKAPQQGKSDVYSTGLISVNVWLVPSVPNATSWSTVELGIAIICACLPTYRKLLPSKYVFLVTVQSWYNSLLGTVRTTRTGESGGNASFAGHSNYSRFGGNEEDNSTDRERLTKAVRGRDGGHRGTPVPLNVISVEHRVDVV